MKRIIRVLFVCTMILLFSVFVYASESRIIFLGFDDNKMPEGITPNFDYKITDGVLSADIANTDPFLTYKTTLESDNYAKVVVRLKCELTERDDKKTPACQYFYSGTDRNGNKISIAEQNSNKVEIPLTTNGSFITCEIPIDHTKLEGAVLDTIRFDIVNCKGSFSVDYIAIMPKNPNPDMVVGFNTDGDKEGFGYANLTAAPVVSGGVISGKTANSSSGLITKNFSPAFAGNIFTEFYVRLMLDNLATDAQMLFYTDLVNSEGEIIKPWSQEHVDENGKKYKYVSNTVLTADNGKYKVYKFDYSLKPAFVANSISNTVLNMVNTGGVDFSIDYIIYKNKNSFEWTFDNEGYWGGWSAKTSGFSLSNGNLVYTAPEIYNNPRIEMTGISVSGADYTGLEVIMKHNFVSNESNAPAEKSTIQLYYGGVTADGTSFSFSESTSVKTEISGNSGENYRYYYLDLSSKNNWKESTITSLRLDPINSNGDTYIDYIRLVPAEGALLSELDKDKITVSYEFENEKSGDADGSIIVDFGKQSYKNARSILFYWATGNASEGYTALPEYTAIKSIPGEKFLGKYKINKNMVIPKDADALAVEITDKSKTFTVYYNIPDNKRLPSDRTPLYTAGLISDIHVGGWGSEESPNVRLVAARDQLSQYADFVVIDGDITQWYGAFSGEEFRAYNYDGTSYKNNGEESTEYLGIGRSQWTVLESYLKGFEVPVYVVQGNHDIRDSNNWSAMIESEKYWKPFLRNWIEYSNNSENGQRYINRVYDDAVVNYYDTEINGHHFIFLSIPKTEAPQNHVGETQLEWLDKKLFEKEATGKPVFVFGHMPLETNLNESYSDEQIKDDAELKAVLEKHPTAIYVSGHTHYSLNVDYLSSIDGAQLSPSFIHDGGTTTINTPLDESKPAQTEEIQASHGVLAEVYEDGILLKGRDFVGDKWISRGYTYLSFRDVCDVDEISVTKRADAENTVLYVSGAKDCAVSWYLNGELQEENGISLVVDNDYSGYVAVRVTDSSGNYRSEVYDSIEKINSSNTQINFTEIIADGVTFDFTLDEQHDTAMYIVAGFDSDMRLLDAAIDYLGSEAIVSGSVSVNLDTDGTKYVKVMLLDCDGTILPLCEEYLLEN